jgi:2-polyprenyl-6-methoxyphenol hydroxylase-like FAD-dependent oxidoreductase
VRDDLGDHAVVLGAGMAGLLTAGVLSERYRTVTVVERDTLPDGALQRRGVPQGRHLHGLLSRGSQVMDELFPGFLEELTAAGAQVLDDGNLSRSYTRIGPYRVDRSHQFADPGALVTHQASRPLLESLLRRRVGALSNVTFLDGHDVVEPTAPSSDRVSGVLVVDRATGVSTVLGAELVVDAMGRGARTPAVLEKIGYGRPDEIQSSSRTTYFSQFLTLPNPSFREKLVMVLPGNGARIGGLIGYEHDTWVLTVGGLTSGDEPPADFPEMLLRARQFMPLEVFSALRSARPLSGVATFRHTGGAWRRYDRMDRHPAGLLAIGDAVCTLNPIHGQGMTVAALQALALRAALGTNDTELPHRFYRAAAEVIGPTWAMNHARSARPAKRRTLSQRAATWSTAKVLRAAETDIVLTERILRVSNLVDPPTRLRDPLLLGRVLLGRSRAAGDVTAQSAQTNLSTEVHRPEWTSPLGP